MIVVKILIRPIKFFILNLQDYKNLKKKFFNAYNANNQF